MTREEAIIDFKKMHFEPMLKENIKSIETYCMENKEDLVNKYINFINGVFNDFKNIKDDYIDENAIILGHIYFKRTDLMVNRRLRYYFAIYIDKNSKYENAECYELDYIYMYIDKLFNVLERPRKTYVGKVTKADITKMIYEKLDIFMENVILILKDAMIEDYIKTKYISCKYLSILIGEYINIKKVSNYKKSEQILLVPEVDNIKIYKWLDKNKVLKGIVIDNINLRKGCLKEKTIINSVFKNCVIEVSNLTLSNLYNSKFIDCEIINSSFSAINITGVNFKNSYLNKVSFNFAIFNDKDIKDKLSFINSKLKEVSFDYADLRDSKFIDAEMEEVSFKNASLKGAEFSKALKESEMFTEEQKAEIVWI